MRRALADTLLELVGAAHVAGSAGPALRITGFDLDVPIEVRLRRSGDTWELLADLPRWRWQTGLEEPRGRLRMTWGEGGGP